jgi:hypothetical protein
MKTLQRREDPYQKERLYSLLHCVLDNLLRLISYIIRLTYTLLLRIMQSDHFLNKLFGSTNTKLYRGTALTSEKLALFSSFFLQGFLLVSSLGSSSTLRGCTNVDFVNLVANALLVDESHQPST